MRGENSQETDPETREMDKDNRAMVDRLVKGETIQGTGPEMREIGKDNRAMVDRLVKGETIQGTGPEMREIGKKIRATVVNKAVAVIGAMVVQMKVITTSTDKKEITDRITVTDTMVKIGKTTHNTMAGKIMETSMRQETEDLVFHQEGIVRQMNGHILKEGDNWVIICRLRIFQDSNITLPTSIQGGEKG